jgi:hypothetical protein
MIMSLDVEALASQMLEAALPILNKGAQNATSFAKTEFRKIAETIVAIGEQLSAGEINERQAVLLLSMQTSASRNVFLTLQGLALLAVEEAINAALDVVKTAVNTAVGFALIA